MIPEPEAFNALGHKTRLQILSLLAQYSPANLSYLSRMLSASDTHVSHHIGILLRAGLVEKKKVGTWSTFTLNREKFKILILFLGSMLERKDEVKPNDDEGPTA